jgi:hypothetical protein
MINPETSHLLVTKQNKEVLSLLTAKAKEGK